MSPIGFWSASGNVQNAKAARKNAHLRWTASICACEEEKEAGLQLEYSRVSVPSKRWGLRHGWVSMTRRRGPHIPWPHLAPTHKHMVGPGHTSGFSIISSFFFFFFSSYRDIPI